MFAFILTVGLVYVGGLVWNFVRSGGATWQFNWPLVVAKRAYDAWTLKNVK